MWRLVIGLYLGIDDSSEMALTPKTMGALLAGLVSSLGRSAGDRFWIPFYRPISLFWDFGLFLVTGVVIVGGSGRLMWGRCTINPTFHPQDWRSLIRPGSTGTWWMTHTHHVIIRPRLSGWRPNNPVLFTTQETTSAVHELKTAQTRLKEELLNGLLTRRSHD